MADQHPKKSSARVALTKAQATEGLGRELIEMSRAWLADGKFDAQELEQLRAWLQKVPADSVPAMRFLKEEVQRYVADGEIHDWELDRLHAALMRVIPPKEREEAKNARSEAARVLWEKRAPERESARRAAAERSQELRERYAGIWTKESATDAQLEFIRELGGTLPKSASKLEASETIDRLLGREVVSASSTKRSGCLPTIVVAAVTVLALVVWVAWR